MAEFPDMSGRDLEELGKVFRYFGEIETPRLDSDVYTVYSLGIADDPEMLELASHAKAGQPAPNVLYAAVHDLLLRDAEAGRELPPLARWYPSVSGQPIPEASPWEAFRTFCIENRARLLPAIMDGKTQTCVVHRSAVILPALACLPGVAGARGRVGLLEIGPSAGLNLRLDRYRYEYSDGSVWGDPEARPVLVVENRGDASPPLPDHLEIAARHGLELDPIDLSDADAVRWLKALIWPEHVERAKAMDAALAHISRSPANIVQGDATTDIEGAVRALPEDAARVVFATQVFYQIPAEGRRLILDGLARASQAMPVDLILMESSGEGDSIVSHFPFDAGERGATRELARVDSHGRWIDWRER